MWTRVVRLILRNRLTILIGIFLFTCFMGWKATDVRMDYEMIQMLPQDDPAYIEYENFKEKFGMDGSMMLLGIEGDEVLQLENYQQFYNFTNEISSIEGVDTVLSLSKVYNIKRDTVNNKLSLVNVVPELPETQEEIDSLTDIIFNLPFYKGFLYQKTDTSFITIMAITLDEEILNQKARQEFVAHVVDVTESFSEKTNIDIRYSGLPYIRAKTMAKVSNELAIFIALAALVLAIILYVFFKSFRVVAVSLLIVGIAVIWVLGTLSLLDYKMTILTALIPPLIIVIGIPNCIFLMNKYHQEFKKHGNKIKALSRVVQKVGNAILLTNITTASGFATFIVVRSDVLSEFGLVASVNIMGIWLLSLLIITIIFSYLPPPREKHTKHLENFLFRRAVSKLVRLSIDHRPYVYVVTLAVLIFSIIGISRVKTTGNVVDDIPHKEQLYQDLLWFEHHFTGVLPYEIKIDTKKDNGVFEDNARTLYYISRLYREVQSDTLFSNYFGRPVSLIDGISFLNQAHNNGDPKHYLVPSAADLAELRTYLENDTVETGNFKSFIDSNNRYTRVSLQMANIGTNKIQMLNDSLYPIIQDIFNPPRWYNSWMEEEEPISTLIEEFEMGGNEDIEAETETEIATFSAEDWEAMTKREKDSIVNLYRLPDVYDVTPTGMSVVFLKGTNFLIRNLFVSLGLAVLLISLFMAWMFRSGRMVLISLIPNLIPLLFTAAIMGYFGISIKPSTILVFSIAFGISVDDTIHFLAKYRQELRLHCGNKRKSAVMALRETGFSMMYTSIVLFFGFSIFIASTFGGTEALGILVSITLLVAMLTNLVLLPSLILTLEHIIHSKKIKKSRIQIFDDEEARLEQELDPHLAKLLRKRMGKKAIKNQKARK